MDPIGTWKTAEKIQRCQVRFQGLHQFLDLCQLRVGRVQRVRGLAQGVALRLHLHHHVVVHDDVDDPDLESEIYRIFWERYREM